ncbi:MAG: branched-chain amino acid ABC transporter permease, partial [Roseovarius sp.]|nr:branched-chain amino acid ABC transporter permease [Roseovarius sp.]
MNLAIFLLALFDGVAYAALVFIVALGLTLIFGVMRILNVAHGSLYAIGAYATVSLVGYVLALGFAPAFAFPLMIVSAILVGIVIGAPLEYFLLRRIYDKSEVLQLLVTFAVFMILEDVQRLVWGTQPYFNSST